MQTAHLALYLQHVGVMTQSRGAVEEAVNAVSWMHELAGLPAIGSAPIVTATVTLLKKGC